jgi:hypothetical protein
LKINTATLKTFLLNDGASSSTPIKPTALAISSTGKLFITSSSTNEISIVESQNSTESASFFLAAEIPEAPANVVSFIQAELEAIVEGVVLSTTVCIYSVFTCFIFKFNSF